MSIAENIQKYARIAGMNLHQLALRSEVSYQTLYAAVKRKSNTFSQCNLEKIAKALGVTVDMLTASEEIQAIRLTDAEKEIIATLNAIVGDCVTPDDREAMLYLINTYLETNSPIFRTTYKMYSRLKEVDKPNV